MNKVFLIGNLTRDPELTETQTGIAVCRFSIAVNRPKFGDNEPVTDFFNVTAWRGLGETVARYAQKGKKVAVIGSVQIRNYDDKDGVKRTAVDVIATDVEFLSPKGSDDFDNSSSSKPAKKKPVLQEIDDDGDIPF